MGTVLGPYNYKQNQGPQNGAQKWNPKQGPKLDPNQAPKCNPGPQICTGTQTRTCRDDVHSAVCWAILFKCATNNFNQRRKGDLGGQNCSNREHEYIHRPNIVKTCFTCRRYTLKSHAWENQRHACYYGGTPMRHRKTACFEALVLEPHFAQSCGRFLLLYCILGWQSSLQASFHWKMQNVKLPVSNTCRLHMFKQWSNLLSGPVKQGNKVSLWRHSENRGENAGVPPAPFKQC